MILGIDFAAELWDNMTRFCDDVGWDIMWDFNLFVWRDGQWSPTEADKFLKYSAARGVNIPSFQLGNGTWSLFVSPKNRKYSSIYISLRSVG